MKKLSFHLVGGFIAFFFLVFMNSCLKTRQAPLLENDDIEKIKQWFHANWKKTLPIPHSERTSAWHHDTNFVQNNYANLIPDWRFAKVYNIGSVRYTEVPATLRDSLEFKIGSTDSIQFVSNLTNTDYSQRYLSKHVLLVKEESGQEIYAEVVSFIGDYNYVKSDYDRFQNQISYFNMEGYSGLVMYHDKNGDLLRLFEYVKGQVVNIVRCSAMAGLDPEPNNRVHLDVCYEVLTWERDCLYTYDEYGIQIDKVCSEWMLVGSYMVGNCFESDGASGGGTYHPISEDGFSCESFQFIKTTSNWQEAGITDIPFKMRWLGGIKGGKKIEFMLGSPIVIGLPVTQNNGEYHSPGRAAELASKAMNYAFETTCALLKMVPVEPTKAEIESMFRKYISLFISNHGGTASRSGSGNSNIILKKARFTFLGSGDCD